MRFEQARDCFLELVKGDPERQRKSQIPGHEELPYLLSSAVSWQVLVRADDTM